MQQSGNPLWRPHSTMRTAPTSTLSIRSRRKTVRSARPSRLLRCDRLRAAIRTVLLALVFVARYQKPRDHDEHQPPDHTTTTPGWSAKAPSDPTAEQHRARRPEHYPRNREQDHQHNYEHEQHCNGRHASVVATESCPGHGGMT